MGVGVTMDDREERLKQTIAWLAYIKPRKRNPHKVEMVFVNGTAVFVPKSF